MLVIDVFLFFFQQCRQTVITYGDAVECMIRLDEAQYTP